MLYSQDFDKKINAEVAPFVVKQIEIYNNTEIVKNMRGISPIVNQSLNSENIILFRSEQYNESDYFSYELTFYLKKEENPKVLIYAYGRNNSGKLSYNGKEIYEEASQNTLFNKGEKYLQPGANIKIALKNIHENDTINFHYCVANLDFRNSSVISTVTINGSQFISNSTSGVIFIEGIIQQTSYIEEKNPMDAIIIPLVIISILLLCALMFCLRKKKKCKCLYNFCCKCCCCCCKKKIIKKTPEKKKIQNSGDKKQSSSKNKKKGSSTKKDGKLYELIPGINLQEDFNRTTVYIINSFYILFSFKKVKSRKH